MTRRRRESVAESLAAAPWWVSAGLAVAVFIAAKFFSPLIHFEDPVFTVLNVLAGLSQQHAHYIALPFIILALFAAVNRLFRQRLLDKQTDIESIRNLSWQEFELLVGESFRRDGYGVEENGGGGADGGVDLRLSRNGKLFIVQCKRWKDRKVGVSAIRELFGLMTAERADGAYFVSSGEFSREAIRFADATKLVLVDGAELARRIVTTVQRADGRSCCCGLLYPNAQ